MYLSIQFVGEEDYEKFNSTLQTKHPKCLEKFDRKLSTMKEYTHTRISLEEISVKSST